jgi:hypothetical protein
MFNINFDESIMKLFILKAKMKFTSKLKYYLTSALKNQAKVNKINSENVDNLKVKIGLEIHARILSKSKIFSKLIPLKLEFSSYLQIISL